MSKPKVIIVTGPTASGKTKLAVQLAEELEGEIISADSRQVFKTMDLGTGKDLEEYNQIPYHLIDILNPGEKYSASRFQQEAMAALEGITERNKLPIICGGTGHYLKALIQGYPFDHPATDTQATLELENLPWEELLQEAEKAGVAELERFKGDSKRRLARAIEKQTQRVTDNPTPSFTDLYDYKAYYLEPPREEVRAKITTRLEDRFSQGMTKEVKTLLCDGVSPETLQSYGLEYKWITRFLLGEVEEAEMKEKLARDIKAFAKRQMTFVRYMVKEGVNLTKVGNFTELKQSSVNYLA